MILVRLGEPYSIDFSAQLGVVANHANRSIVLCVALKVTVPQTLKEHFFGQADLRAQKLLSGFSTSFPINAALLSFSAGLT